MEKIFFYLTLFVSLFCFNGCSFDYETTVEFILPQWPPENSENYAELSRWCVEVTGSEKQKFFVEKGQSSFSLKINKSKLTSITATPITCDSEENEICFFKPCGIIVSGEKNVLSWENGFSSKVLALCINGANNQKEAADFVSRFNWNRFESLVEEKIRNGLKSFESETKRSFYNPWHLNPSEIAASICNGKFTASCLNISSSKTIDSSLEGAVDFPDKLLSSFVIENEICSSYGSFCLNKDVINLFSMYNECGVLIECSKPEKLWTETIKLPIYIE